MKLLYTLIILFAFFMGCDKDPVTPEPEPELFDCTGLTEVELWGEWYDIEETTYLSLESNGLTGSIPPEIGNLTNLGWLDLYSNQLAGEIPTEVCDLIESNNLEIPNILYGNNLILCE